MPSVENMNIAEAIQRLYRFNEDDAEFSEGIDSVTLIYTKAHESQVAEQLAAFPPRVPYVHGSPLNTARKAVHVQGLTGTRSLAVLEQCFNIEVPDPSIFLSLNNPSNPPWVVCTPRDRAPMSLRAVQQVLDKHPVSERAAWEKFESWVRSMGLSVRGEQHPNGENSFPDYRAWIQEVEYNIEMTSVPDMEKWTVRSTYRDVEWKISEMAKQPSETREEVVDAVSRVLQKKSTRVGQVVGDEIKGGLCWSYPIGPLTCWPETPAGQGRTFLRSKP